MVITSEDDFSIRKLRILGFRLRSSNSTFVEPVGVRFPRSHCLIDEGLTFNTFAKTL